MVKDPYIIFVTGASRSGTTMLNKILGANSRILSLKELHYFGGMVDVERLSEKATGEDLVNFTSIIFTRNAKGLWGGEPSETEINLAKELVKAHSPENTTYAQLYSHAVNYLAATEKKDIACEQTPRNIFYAKTLLRSYPNSKFIHIIRDPRAVLASQKAKWRQKKLGGHKIPLMQVLRVWINYHPITMSKLWVNATRAATQLSSSNKIMLIRYEDIVEFPDKILRDICEFLDVDYELEMLNISTMGSSYRESNQGNKGISKEGLNRWKNNLSEGEISICEIITDEYMNKFSYKKQKTKSKYLHIALQVVAYPFHLLGVVITNPARLWIQLKAMYKSAA